MIVKTYTEKRFFKWCEDERSVSLRFKSGSYGGGSEVFVIYEKDAAKKIDTLVFNEAQITSPTNANKPGWNEPCHAISSTDAGRAVVIIRENEECGKE